MNTVEHIPGIKIFSTDALVPEVWRKGGAADFYVFNPGITLFRGRRIMAYRVVGPDRLRRLAVCRLDEKWDIIAGSAVPLSDHIKGAGGWHADPRFCTLGERLFLHFNDGFRRPNHIFLLELEPATLLPAGPARQLVPAGGRREVEKNWTLFEHGGEMLAVYSVAPHVILRVMPDAGGDSVPCARVHESDWDDSAYARSFGAISGGTPPVRLGGSYFSFFHSRRRLPFARRLLHRCLYGGGVRVADYVMGFYEFASVPPFAPLSFTPAPVMLPPRSKLKLAEQLNRKVTDVVYPCGAVCQAGVWAVSFGLHDAYCGIRLFSHDQLRRLSVKIPAPGAAPEGN